METGRDGEESKDLRLIEVFLWSRDERGWRSDHWGVVICAVYAALAGAAGVGISAASSLGLLVDGSGRLKQIGAVLMLAVILLVLLAAACLDRLEASLRAEDSRVASSRRDGEIGLGEPPTRVRAG